MIQLFDGITANAELERKAYEDMENANPSSIPGPRPAGRRQPKSTGADTLGEFITLGAKGKTFKITERSKDFNKKWRRSNKQKKELLKKFNRG